MNKNNSVPYLFADAQKQIWQENLYNSTCILLFSDYDGTLAEFHSDPAKTFPYDKIPELLQKLTAHLIYEPTIITGREPEDIRELMPEPRLPVAGLHGLFYLPPDEQEPQPILDKPPALPENIENFLVKSAERHSNLELENKRLLKALHFNRKISQLYRQLEGKLRDYASETDWEVIAGRRVLEVRPENWHKGKAVQHLRQKFAAEAGYENPQNCLTIYLGDDTTDEDVFKTLFPPKLTVYISNTQKAEHTRADYFVNSPAEVQNFLQHLLNILET